MKYFLLLCCLLLSPALAHAERNHNNSSPQYTADQAVSAAEQRMRGRVVATQTVFEDGEKLYRLKVVTDNGDVRVVYFNARTGRME